MKTYFLKYNKPNTHTFYDIVKSPEQVEMEKKISTELDLEKRKQMHFSADWKRFSNQAKDIKIVPGINEISEEDYNSLKGHPAFDHSFDTRPPIMEWVPGFSPEDEKMKVFASLKDREALNIIENMWSKPLLEKYLTVEKRETIKKAVEDQLKKLEIRPQKSA